METLPVCGVVLAGGRSSRFGSDKALAVLNGLTLLERALASLSGCAERLVVGGDQRYDFAGVPVVPDERPGEGPLAGLATALRAATQERVALCACDMPFLRREYWALLVSLPQAAVVVPEGPDGRLEPLAALYGRESLPAVEAALQEGLHALGGWHDYLARYGLTRTVVPYGEVEQRFGRAMFANINRPQDWPADSEPL